jgi:UDP-N-acetylmuramyl pentapeptide phosphotransferase/UDP-N-acetylglucosamine-1-phosphate transferase
MLDSTLLATAVLIAALASLAVCSLIVLTQRWHGALSLDNRRGKQKFHKIPVPRIGGAGLLAGVVAAATWVNWGRAPGPLSDLGAAVAALVGAALPVFAAGLIEDLTKRVPVPTRLGLTLVSALLAWWSLDAVLPRIGLPLVDDLLGLLPVAVVVTAFAVAGVTNAFNVIDGFNGLAGSTAIAVLGGMAFLGWRCGDALVLELALLGVGTTIGFLLLNYPRGSLFMGDGGAYFLGFWCAEIAVLLACRNPGISPWQLLALHAYPVTEVLYSMFRKKVLRGMSPAMPDRLHLHMLLYRRCICRALPRNAARPWLRNAAVAGLAAPWMAAWTIVVVALADTQAIAMLLLGLHAVAYIALYVRLLRGHWWLYPSAILGRLTRAVRARFALSTRAGQ